MTRSCIANQTPAAGLLHSLCSIGCLPHPVPPTTERSPPTLTSFPIASLTCAQRQRHWHGHWLSRSQPHSQLNHQHAQARPAPTLGTMFSSPSQPLFRAPCFVAPRIAATVQAACFSAIPNTAPFSGRCDGRLLICCHVCTAAAQTVGPTMPPYSSAALTWHACTSAPRPPKTACLLCCPAKH